jgi:hypothetical protein
LKLLLVKTPGGFSCADQQTADLHAKLKTGQTIHGDFKRLRNARFHRKFFSLLQLGFEYFEPEQLNTKWGEPEKEFENFRENVTIIAGYGYPVFNLDNTFRVKAKSISFANMEQDEFEKLYQDVLTVLMQKIPVLAQMGSDEIDRVTDLLIGYA